MVPLTLKKIDINKKFRAIIKENIQTQHHQSNTIYLFIKIIKNLHNVSVEKHSLIYITNVTKKNLNGKYINIKNQVSAQDD
jgi:hypothetical protein